MYKEARVIRFPVRCRESVDITSEEASRLARAYLAIPLDDRTEKDLRNLFSGPEILFATCQALREQRDTRPREVAVEASRLYWRIQKSESRVGIFDEKDYLLGETAFLAGSCYRHLGERDETLRWLDRSEAAYRHTVNPGPGLSNVAYTRLALRFEAGRYDEVLELIPSVRTSFERLGMRVDLAKCQLLEAMTLKQTGRLQAALAVLKNAQDDRAVIGEPFLRARVLAEIGDVLQLDGKPRLANEAYGTALELLEDAPTCLSLADLRMFVAAAYRSQGQLNLALQALRSSMVAYSELEMPTRVAYVRLFIADTLLGLSRPREAEWEILAALPAIERGNMVPDGLAAVALLQESVRQKQTDRTALRELQDRLETAK